MKRLATMITLFALLLAAGQALAAEKSIVVGFGLMHGVADLAANTGNGVNSAFQSPEIGGRFEYWNQMKENYALNFQANVGFQTESDKPRNDAAVGRREAKFTTSSWSVRLGGDRTWKPLPNTTLFIGPGFEYWTGKAKFVDVGGNNGTYETESVTRFSLHGHTGAMMMMGSMARIVASWRGAAAVGPAVVWPLFGRPQPLTAAVRAGASAGPAARPPA